MASTDRHRGQPLDALLCNAAVYLPRVKKPVRSPEGYEISAATDLVFKGLAQPSGYTEPLLHAWRLKVKAGRA